MHYWGYYGWGAGMGIMMIVFWALVIIGIVYLVRYLAKGPPRYEPRETPLDILKKRYAKGEITKEEYNRIKDDLKD
jgi:putative membrane protein